MKPIPNSRQDADLAKWLATATAGLDPRAAAAIRAEITDHYQDAVDDYVNHGANPAEAARQALADLGLARHAAAGFKDTHLGRRRYLAAAISSALAFLVLLFFPLAYEMLPLPGYFDDSVMGPLVYDLLLLVPTLYVLVTLRQLLTWRFELGRIAPAVHLCMGALVLLLVLDGFSLSLYGFSVNLGIGYPPGGSSAAQWLVALSLAGLFALGLSLMAVAWQLARWPGDLYGLRLLLAGVLLVMGLPMSLAWILQLAGWSAIMAIAGMLAVLGHALIWPLLILLFFRAIMRHPLPPDALGRPTRLA